MTEATKLADGGEKLPGSKIQDYIFQVPDFNIPGYDISMNEWMGLAADANPKF
jgi:hypothetical protein